MGAGIEASLFSIMKAAQTLFNRVLRHRLSLASDASSVEVICTNQPIILKINVMSRLSTRETDPPNWTSSPKFRKMVIMNAVEHAWR